MCYWSCSFSCSSLVALKLDYGGLFPLHFYHRKLLLLFTTWPWKIVTPFWWLHWVIRSSVQNIIGCQVILLQWFFNKLCHDYHLSGCLIFWQSLLSESIQISLMLIFISLLEWLQLKLLEVQPLTLFLEEGTHQFAREKDVFLMRRKVHHI